MTLVDRAEWGGLGGACLHVGCIPSKALIELGEAFTRANATPGMTATAATVDLAAFQAHKRELIGRLTGGVGALMRGNDVTVLEGEARFVAPDRVVVATAQRAVHLQFADAIVATGSRPAELGVLPFDGGRVVDSAGLLALEELPQTLCVAGGGYVGLELGIAFAKLGTKVTIVEALPELLPDLDRDLARLVERSLKQLGVDLMLGARLTGADDETVVVAAVSGEERRIPAERVVVAIGRRPNSDGLGLGELRITPTGGGLIPVDGARIAAPHVAALGDVTAGPALAHKATAEAQVAVRALSGQPAAFAPQAIPVVMFTDPEIATAGLTATSARAEGLDVVAETFPTGTLGRPATLGRRDGIARLVAERDGGAVIGAQIAGPHASELIAEATLAIEMGATLEDLALTIHAHPTLAEGIAEAAELALGHPVHVVRRRAAAAT